MRVIFYQVNNETVLATMYSTECTIGEKKGAPGRVRRAWGALFFIADLMVCLKQIELFQFRSFMHFNGF